MATAQVMQRYACQMHGEHSLKRRQAIYDEQRWTDATLFCRGKTFGVHRAVVGVYSVFLGSMFDEMEKRGDRSSWIVLNEPQQDVLGLILELIYSGQVRIPKDREQAFFRTCEYLQITCGHVRDKEFDGHQRSKEVLERSTPARAVVNQPAGQSGGRGLNRKRARPDEGFSTNASSDDDDNDTHVYGSESKRLDPGSVSSRGKRGRGGRGGISRAVSNLGESSSIGGGSLNKGGSSESELTDERLRRACKTMTCEVRLDRLDLNKLSNGRSDGVGDSVLECGAVGSVDVEMFDPGEAGSGEDGRENPSVTDDKGIQVEKNVVVNGVCGMNDVGMAESGVKEASPASGHSGQSEDCPVFCETLELKENAQQVVPEFLQAFGGGGGNFGGGDSFGGRDIRRGGGDGGGAGAAAVDEDW